MLGAVAVKHNQKPESRSSLRRQRRQALLGVVLILSATLAPATSTGELAYAGRALAEVLTELQGKGLAIVFSTAVVRPEMKVTAEPTTSEPREILDQILKPLGLLAREGPNGQIVVVPAPPEPSAGGRIEGRVDFEGDRVLQSTISIRIVGTEFITALAEDGTFSFSGLPPRTYALETTSPAFRTQRAENVRVSPGKTSRIHFRLSPSSVFLNEIIVTPSHFRILDDHPESRQFLTREEVSQMPHVADDLYRAVKRLPGASGGDYSAKFNIRGGDTDEVLVILDGLELSEPFHLKDFQSIFSTVDAEATGGVDLLTGGFPVEYGDRMSGVLDIAIATPTGPAQHTVGLSTMNGRFLSEGSLHEGRGHWLVSGRGWYPDAVFEAFGTSANEILADYYDLLAKFEHRVGRRSSLSINALLAHDNLGFRAEDAEELEIARARYSSYHTWLNLRTDWSDSLFSQTVVSVGSSTRERRGWIDDIEEGTLEIDDDREFDFIGFKQNWSFDIGDHHLLKWGMEFKHQDASYDYSRITTTYAEDDGAFVDRVLSRVEPNGESWAAFVADRLRLTDKLIAELGLRWDRQTWLADSQISPRINLRYSLGPRTTLRIAWGEFSQAQRLYELQIEDGDTRFHDAQRATHWLSSLEHRLASGLAFRVEAYHKRFEDLRPRYENLFNPIELFPESREDRVLIEPDWGRAKGLELLIKRDGGQKFSWWVSYALSKAEDSINGTLEPRSWDQRHAVSFGLNLELPNNWNVNLAGSFHSGWPTTAVTAEIVGFEDEEPDVEFIWGPRNQLRYPDYHRLDVRATKKFEVTTGELTLVLEVINLTNRKNTCCVEDFDFEIEKDGPIRVLREETTWAPIIPSVGLRWQF